MQGQHPQRGTATCAAAALLFGALAGSARCAEPGMPFPLHPGQSASLGPDVRVTLTAVQPAGSCPGGHLECVEVAPPQAHVEFAAPPAASKQLVLPLLGRTSPPQAVGAWSLRVVDVAPFPFTHDDAAAARVTVTLLLTAASGQP